MTCNLCGSPIVFIKTDSGRNVPCVPGLQSFRLEQGCGHHFVCNGLILPGVPDKAGGFMGHLPHMEVCPDV